MTDVVYGAINLAAASLLNDHIISVQTPVAAQTTLGDNSKTVPAPEFPPSAVVP